MYSIWYADWSNFEYRWSSMLWALLKLWERQEKCRPEFFRPFINGEDHLYSKKFYEVVKKNDITCNDWNSNWLYVYNTVSVPILAILKIQSSLPTLVWDHSLFSTALLLKDIKKHKPGVSKYIQDVASYPSLHFPSLIQNSSNQRLAKKKANGKSWLCILSRPNVHENEAQSPWKNQRSSQFAVLTKNLNYLHLRNKIRIHSLIPQGTQ